MDKKPFLMGMGLGMAAGGAVGRMLPRKMAAKRSAGRALRNVVGVMDEVSKLMK